MKNATVKETALGRFIHHKGRIDQALKILNEASQNHFDASPEEVHWGHVGTASSLADRLSDLADRVSGTGEYTQEK